MEVAPIAVRDEVSIRKDGVSSFRAVDGPFLDDRLRQRINKEPLESLDARVLKELPPIRAKRAFIEASR